MSRIVTSLASLKELIGVDVRMVAHTSYEYLDGLPSATPFLVETPKGRFLVARAIDKGGIEHANPQGIRRVYYEPYFTFDSLVTHTSDAATLEVALRRALHGADKLTVAADISCKIFEIVRELLPTAVDGAASSEEVYRYDLDRRFVLDRFATDSCEIRAAAQALLGSSSRARQLQKHMDLRPDSRFEQLSVALWDAGVNAFLLSSPLNVQEVSGVPMEECARARALAIVTHDGPVRLLVPEPFSDLGRPVVYRNLHATNSIIPQGAIGIEEEDLDVGRFVALGLNAKTVRGATRMLQAWRERRAVDELAAYIIVAEAQVRAIEAALGETQRSLAAGRFVTENDVATLYRSAVEEFRLRHGIKQALRDYFVILIDASRTVYPSPPTDWVIRSGTKCLKLDAALHLLDSLGLVRACSDVGRHLTFTAAGREFASVMDKGLREVVIPQIRPGMTGAEVYSMGVLPLELDQKRWEDLGLMPRLKAPLRSVFDRDVGHMLSKLTRFTVAFEKGCTEQVRVGMVGTAEYVWPFDGYAFGVEDMYFVGPDGTVNLCEGW